MSEFVWNFTLAAVALYAVMWLAEKLLRKYRDKKAVKQNDGGTSNPAVGTDAADK